MSKTKCTSRNNVEAKELIPSLSIEEQKEKKFIALISKIIVDYAFRQLEEQKEKEIEQKASNYQGSIPLNIPKN